jgi:hypothetical protein
MDNELPAKPQAVADDTVRPTPEAEETETEENQAEEIQSGSNPLGSNETKWMQWEVVMIGILTVLAFLGLLMLYLQLNDIQESNTAILQTVRESAMLDERAWIEPAGIDAPLVAGSPIAISTKVVNRGKTSAQKCATLTYIRHYKYPASPDISILNAKSNTPAPPLLVIGPGQQITLPLAATAHVLAKDVFEGIQSGETRIFVLEKISYDDIFKKHHWIEFCYVFDPKTSQWIDSGNSATNDE